MTERVQISIPHHKERRHYSPSRLLDMMFFFFENIEGSTMQKVRIGPLPPHHCCCLFLHLFKWWWSRRYCFGRRLCHPVAREERSYHLRLPLRHEG